MARENSFDDLDIDAILDCLDFGVLEDDSSTIVEDHQLGDDGLQQNDDTGNAQPVATAPGNKSRPPIGRWTVGATFPDASSCRREIRETAIALHFEVKTIKSDKQRFSAKCASEGCPWRIHAAKLPNVPTFTVRTINTEHSCAANAHPGHQQGSAKWVAHLMKQSLKEDPKFNPNDIIEKIHRDHGITLSYKQAWRVRERIMETLKQSYEEDYRLLPLYCEQIKRTNPGSIASVYVDPADNCFQRLFVSFQASIFGFLNACRPLLALDRIVLKSKYLSTLLLAAGFDGNGEIYPLAFGVVEEENDDNWIWFLSELQHLFVTNTDAMPKLTILSDMKRGIVDGVTLNFPTACLGYCMRFLTESFQKNFKNTTLVSLFLEAANALTRVECERKLIAIEYISGDAAFWIRNIPHKYWATAYFEGARFGQLTANIAESLESWILDASELPIIKMLECIHCQLMKWFNERRESHSRWTSILTPSADKRVSEALERARTYQVVQKTNAGFEVLSPEGPFTVNIQTQWCLCGGWQLLGLPCTHAAAALLFSNQDVHQFTNSCFTATTYHKTYSEMIHPVPEKRTWNSYELLGNDQDDGMSPVNTVVNPPKSIRPKDRPKNKRAPSRKDSGGEKRVVHCSRCKQTGHFRSTCPEPI